MSVGRSLFDHPGFRKLTTAAGTTLPATIEDRRPHNATTRRALGKAMARESSETLAQRYRVLSKRRTYAGKLGAIFRQLKQGFCWLVMPVTPCKGTCEWHL